MAIAAALAGVGALECELCFRMIELYHIPARRIVTGFATGRRIIFCADKWLVNIFVTIGTGNTYLPETPFFLFFMTGKTRCGQVSTFQGEYARIVLFNRKCKSAETFHGMAGGTIGGNPVLGKLPVVIVCMTVGATAVI